MSEVRRSKSFLQTLYFRVLVGIVAGVIVGRYFPSFGVALKPLGDGFLKLIRMLVAPVVFFTVVTGVAKFGDLRRLGRVGLKSILYFEAVTTLALVIGLFAATLMQPGRGINADPASLDTSSIAQYTTGAVHTGTTDFLLNIIPDSFLGAFTRGEMLQVLLLAVLSGIALATLRGEQKLVGLADSLSQFFFKMVALVMETAPLGAFGAIAFTIGRYGAGSLLSIGKLLLCCYLTSILFIVVVLGIICWANGVKLWQFIVYIREELLIVIATSSSEPALPRLMLKLENLGCSKAITGLVVPAGYSFNSGRHFDLSHHRVALRRTGHEYSSLTSARDLYSLHSDAEFEGRSDDHRRRPDHVGGYALSIGNGTGSWNCSSDWGRPISVRDAVRNQYHRQWRGNNCDLPMGGPV